MQEKYSKKVATSWRFSKQVHEKVVKIAEEEQRSYNEIAEIMLKIGLDKYENDEVKIKNYLGVITQRDIEQATEILKNK